MAISEPLLELIVVSTVGALCFGCGYFAAFIVTYAKFRDEMVKRRAARYDPKTGKWEWEGPLKSRH